MPTVTAVFGIEKNIRSVDDIIKDKTREKTRSLVVIDKKKGVIPQNKVVRATLKGKDQAFKNMAMEVALRDPEGIKERVALMDGEKALANKTKDDAWFYNYSRSIPCNGTALESLLFL